MRLWHNLPSLDILHNYSKVNERQSSSIGRISSGIKVSSAKDDAIAIAKSEKLRMQIRGTEVASRNVQDGISLLQSADGTLSNISDMSLRIKELITQAGNDTNNSSDKNDIMIEISSTIKGINDAANNCDVNGVKLIHDSKVTDDDKMGKITMLVGSNAGETIDIPTTNLANAGTKIHPVDSSGNVDNSKYFVIGLSNIDVTGSNTYTDSTTGIKINDLNLNNLNVYDNNGNVTGTISGDDAARALVSSNGGKVYGANDVIENFRDYTVKLRGKYGAVENRCEDSYDMMTKLSEKMESADSSLRDADIAEEMMNYTKDNILVQAGTALMAQTNKFPQEILSILENVKSK